MNKYLLIDYSNKCISSLEKVETDFEENEEQTSSISCIDDIDLLNTLLGQVKEIIEDYAEKHDIRVCSECGKLMQEGYCIEGGVEYYCNDDCLHKHLTSEEYNELYDDGNGDTYWTQW